MELKNYVKLKKLRTENNIKLFEQGEGFRTEKDGEQTMFFHNGEEIRFAGCISLIPYKYRGNHYHKKRIENLFVISGSIIIEYWLPDNPTEVLKIILESGDIITILPGCAHRCMSKEGALAIEYSAQKFEVNDIIRIESHH